MILDVVRPLAREPRHPEAQRILAWWLDMANFAGISERDFRKTQEAKVARALDAEVVGCSWFKCATFDRKCGPATFYQCTRCGKALYCGIMCQTRFVCAARYPIPGVADSIHAAKGLEGRRP